LLLVKETVVVEKRIIGGKGRWKIFGRFPEILKHGLKGEPALKIFRVEGDD